MKNTTKKLSIALLLIGFMSGCQNGGPKQTGGTLIGGAAGAIIGSQFGHGSGQLVGVALGTAIGAGLGSMIGKSMDDKDRALAAQNAYSALEHEPDRTPKKWHNPNNNHSGDFVITKTTEDSNKVCRDYVQTVNIDGKEEKVHGRACRDVRDHKGEWMVINK